MDHDCQASDPLPTHLEPDERVSCTLVQNDLLRRVMALWMVRYNIPPNYNLSKFELDCAPVKTLIVRPNRGGATITIDPRELMG